MTRTPHETFAELTRRMGVLVTGEAGAATQVAELYAERTHVSFPLAADAGALKSRDALEAHFAGVADRFAGTVTSLQAEEVRIHETDDPEVVVAEFAYRARTHQGELVLPHVFVLRVRDGEILESRDYSAPT